MRKTIPFCGQSCYAVRYRKRRPLKAIPIHAEDITREITEAEAIHFPKGFVGNLEIDEHGQPISDARAYWRQNDPEADSIFLGWRGRYLLTSGEYAVVYGTPTSREANKRLFWPPRLT